MKIVYLLEILQNSVQGTKLYNQCILCQNTFEHLIINSLSGINAMYMVYKKINMTVLVVIPKCDGSQTL